MSTNTVTKRAEADELRNAIQKMGAFDESLYEKLTVAKEKGVADILRRVLDDDAEKRARDDAERSLLRRPLHMIIMESFRVFKETLSDLSEAKTVKAMNRAITVDGRPAYIGVLLVLLAVTMLVFTSC